MSSEQYCFTWDLFKNNISNGFAHLQQKEQFVDMTLVADGHLVKVHKNLIALASPFIKEMILSTPCKHPILFLSNVSHEILNYILEYIYTGEVKVESDKLQRFLKTAKELSLCGIDKVISDEFVGKEAMPVVKSIIEVKKERTEVPCFDGSMSNYDTPNVVPTVDISLNLTSPSVEQNTPDNLDSTEMDLDLNITNYNTDKNNSNAVNFGFHSEVPVIEIDTSGSIPQQYTVSNRGSLQLILNRYIYCMHHQASRGAKRRWRCIDYRLKRCPAYIDTFNETIVTRKNVHGHPFHDIKIMQKVRRNQIYGSYDVAINEARNTSKNKNNEIDLSELDYEAL